MPVQPDWSALRRPLRSCAIGALVLLAFLSFWQFFIPGDHSASLLVTVPFLVATSVCLASGIGLPVSATRRLWRSGQRRRAVLPLAFLPVVVVAFPRVASAVEAHWTVVFGSVLVAFVISAAFSTYLLITTQAAAPVATGPTDFNTDEPHAYASDIPRKRTSG